MKLNKTLVKVADTATKCVFLLIGATAALSLRGDIKPAQQFDFVVGSILLAFVLVNLFTVIYNAKDKE